MPKNILSVFVICWGLLIICSFSGFAVTGSDSCSSAGVRQYMPDGSCLTKIRTCCANGYFTNWKGSCSGRDNCKSNQCWINNACVNRPQPEGIFEMTGGTFVWSCLCQMGIGSTPSKWSCSKSVTCNAGWIRNSSALGTRCMRYAWDLSGSAGSGGSVGDCDGAPTCSSSSVNKTCTRIVYKPCISKPGLGVNCAQDGDGNLIGGVSTTVSTCRLVNY